MVRGDLRSTLNSASNLLSDLGHTIVLYEHQFLMCKMKMLAFEPLTTFMPDSLSKTLNIERSRLPGPKVGPDLQVCTYKNKLKADFWVHTNSILVYYTEYQVCYF